MSKPTAAQDEERARRWAREALVEFEEFLATQTLDPAVWERFQQAHAAYAVETASLTPVQREARLAVELRAAALADLKCRW